MISPSARRTGRETEDNQKEEKVENARKERSHEMQGKRVTFREDQMMYRSVVDGRRVERSRPRRGILA